MEDLVEIARLIEALRPWGTQVVIAGGWGHRLYRFHPSANSPAYLPVMTRDADIAFSLEEPMEGDIRKALEIVGFKAELRSDRTPPVSHYHFGDEDKGFYAEFLVPLTGGLLQRNGEPVPLTVNKAGITAQKLRYLDILLLNPWTLVVDSTLGFDLKTKAQVLLPNPVCFIAQKLLIKERREKDKQSQDVLYIHDTLDLFARNFDELRSLWLSSICPKLAPKIARDVLRLSEEQFSTVSDTIRNSVRIPQDRYLSAQNVQKACAYGLREIFRPK